MFARKTKFQGEYSLAISDKYINMSSTDLGLAYLYLQPQFAITDIISILGKLTEQLYHICIWHHC